MKKTILVLMTLVMSSAAMAFEVDSSNLKTAVVKLDGKIIEMPKGVANIYNPTATIDGNAYSFIFFTEHSSEICRLFGYQKAVDYESGWTSGKSIAINDKGIRISQNVTEIFYKISCQKAE
jgi:hypothetical protein